MGSVGVTVIAMPACWPARAAAELGLADCCKARCSRMRGRSLRAVLIAAVFVLAGAADAQAQTPSAPVVASVVSGPGSLEVAWNAATSTAALPVTSYDVRYIETSARDKADSRWQTPAGRWVSGPLEYTITGLAGDVSYDVQVRARNAQRPGMWSATSTGTPTIGAPTIVSLATGERGLSVLLDRPPFAAPGSITGYQVHFRQSALPGSDPDDFLLASVAGPGRVILMSYLRNDVRYDVQIRAVTTTEGPWSEIVSAAPVEHGDTRAQATNLPLGVPVMGILPTHTDVDYFKFDVDIGTGVTISTSPHPRPSLGGGVDTVGELYDSNGNLVRANDDGFLAPETRDLYIWDSLAAGTYYLKITGYDGDTGYYLLRTATVYDSSGRSDAPELLLGGSQSGLIETPSDVDYYRFVLGVETDVLVHGTSRVEGELQDADGRPVTGTESYDLPTAGFLIRKTLPAGVYVLRVQGAEEAPERRTTGAYDLYVSRVREPGDSINDATQAARYRAVTGTIDSDGDTDFFRIDLASDAHVSVRAAGAEIGVQGRLLDSSSNAVDADLHEQRFTPQGPTGFELFGPLSAGSHYIEVTAAPGSTGSYVLLMYQDVLQDEFVEDCGALTSSIGDVYYGCQWSLDNTGQRKGTPGEDINASDAWSTSRGAGITVAVVDDGMQHDHPDLTSNVASSLNHDYTGGNDIYDRSARHGTMAAGVIAAKDNNIGVRGIAHRSRIYGLNLLANRTVANEADAMVRNMAVTAVSNNSWGAPDIPVPGRAPAAWERAVDSGVTSGFSGKGVLYVFEAGDNDNSGAYSTLDEYANYYGVTAVCAVNDLGRRARFSQNGANLWVCAPSRDGRLRPLGPATTENYGRYSDRFEGTGAAAAHVSGAAALVRSVDNQLDWRDVKLILAASARKNHAGDSGWETGALKYGSSTERYQFNHSYGFGVVDATAAVALVDNWSKLPAMRKAGPFASATGVSIPVSRTQVSSTANVETGIGFVEFAQVDATFNAARFRDLQIELVSPAGAVSVLSVPESDGCPWPSGATTVPCSLEGSFRFGSARHLGEDPSGTWTLRIADRVPGGAAARLESWSITLYGHQTVPDAPTLDYVRPAGTSSLTVAWHEPAYTGTFAVTGYDVRHIRSNATNKSSDGAWTLVSPAASASGRQHTLTGLTSGVSRDVQVRAVNTAGAGAWSPTGTGTPGAQNSKPFFVEASPAERSIPENTATNMEIGPPVTASDFEDDTFTYSLGGTDAGVFGIEASTGQLLTKSPLDHETRSSYRVTVSVHDSEDDDGDSDTAVDASIEVVVLVEDVDEAPEITGEATLTYAENGTGAVGVYTAADPEEEPTELSISGPDASAFELDSDGRVTFDDSPDYEAPADSGGDNVYEFTITASDGVNSRALDVAVTVLDVNEPFEITGDDMVDYVERDTFAVASYTTDDPDEGPVQWTLSGVDGGDFTISDDGRLSFSAVPDFESPADSGRDNGYRVTVKAFDGVNCDTHAVVVNVTNIDEAGSIELSQLQPQVGTQVEASLNDPDGGLTDLVWIWESSTSSSGVGQTITGAQSRSYTPAVGDLGQFLRVRVAYRDGHGSGKSASAVTTRAVRSEPTSNSSPDFSSEDGMRTVRENEPPGTPINGLPVIANDPDPDDLLIYRLSGAAARFFSIDRPSGRIDTRVVLDHEERSSHQGTVTAVDPSGASASVSVTITVLGVEEQGVITLSTLFPRLGATVTASLADPDGGVSNLAWQWQSSLLRSGGWQAIAGAESSSYTPVEADLGLYLRAVAMYTDSHVGGGQDSTVAPSLGKVFELTLPDPDPDPGRGPGPGPVDTGDRDATGTSGKCRARIWPIPTRPSGFVDVNPESVHAQAIEILYAAMVTLGCDTETLRYCPDDPVTRAQMASFLTRTFNLEVPAEPAGFVDVNPDSVHASAIEALYAAGITTGCGTETLQYCPDDPVTREQMASFLARAFQLSLPAPPAGFLDVNPNSVHAGAIDAIYEVGITLGCRTELLWYCPNQPVTRSQMASFLTRC